MDGGYQRPPARSEDAAGLVHPPGRSRSTPSCAASATPCLLTSTSARCAWYRRAESLSIRKGVLQPLHDSEDLGAMVTVRQGRGLGYAATADLSARPRGGHCSRAGLAERTAAHAVFDHERIVMPEPTGNWESVVRKPWESESLVDSRPRMAAAASLPEDDRIVEWEAAGPDPRRDPPRHERWRTSPRSSTSSADATVVVHADGRTQTRSLGLRGHSRQGGLEIADEVDFASMPGRLLDSALSLLSAPDCPSGRMDLLLAPDQMMLQIHESIGHPLELDRILGDERNYAGTSFVTLDMFGSYRYGSELLNVTFDPVYPGNSPGTPGTMTARQPSGRC